MEKIELTLADDCEYGSAGSRVTLALQPQDVHDPTELPEYLAGYKPFMYRADEVSDVVLVDNDEDKYRTFDSDDAFRRVDVKGSTQGAVAEVDPKSSLKAYKVVERFIGSFVPRQTELQTGGSFTTPVMAATRRCRRAIELDREIDVWGLLTDPTGTWAAANISAVGTAWDAPGSDPIADIQGAIEASAQAVTDIWFNQKVANAFLRNDNVRDHMRQMLGDGAVNAAVNTVNTAAEDISSNFLIPGFPAFRVVKGKVLNETTSVLDFIMGDSVVLATKIPGIPSDGEEIATTWTFRSRGPSGTGFEVRQFFVESRGRLGGTMVVVSMADIAKITANNAGGLLTGVHT